MADHAVWTPHPGSQALFVACPIFEALYEGERGPGKTLALLMDFAQHVGQGFGSAWRGVLFRESFPQLADVVVKSRRLYREIFPSAKWNAADHKWTFPDGEELLLRWMRVEADYDNYHGHEYPWIGWEELTNWASPACYESMFACSRSSQPGMPRKVRATTNPFGVGHNWVKARFVDPAPAGTVITDEDGNQRVRIHGRLNENTHLAVADPDYVRRLAAITDPNKRKAWLEGSWDISSGGLFDDLWDSSTHVLRPFDVPASWRIDRSFDWGSSKPFSVGWWAESDGTPVQTHRGQRTFPRGTLIRVAEWYGSTGRPNEGLKMPSSKVAQGIAEREKASWFAGRVRPGPADSSIYDVTDDVSIAQSMAQNGVKWVPADKRAGSRKNGWELLRTRLAAAAEGSDEPGLYVFDTCRDFIRTVPILPRDDRDPDDVDTDAEDHAADETRYRLLAKRRPPVTSEELIG